MYYNLVVNEFEETVKIINKFINSKSCIDSIQSAAQIIFDCFKIEGKVLSCGNGGSHCNAMHFAEEFTGRYRKNRRGYPAIAISDPSYLSCVANDFGYENVFSRYVESVGNSKDVLFAISNSGKSRNILNAIKSAYDKGIKVILLGGKNIDNQFSKYIDIEICVPYSGYLDYIQEIHVKIIHVLILIIENKFHYEGLFTK